MALIKCSECGRLVSDKAKACIHCGNPLNTVNESKVMIYGYTESYLFNPPVNIFIGGQFIGSVAKGNLFEIPIAYDTVILFKCSMRSAKITVPAGRVTKIKLSWNRITGQLVPQIVDAVVPDSNFW